MAGGLGLISSSPYPGIELLRSTAAEVDKSISDLSSLQWFEREENRHLNFSLLGNLEFCYMEVGVVVPRSQLLLYYCVSLVSPAATRNYLQLYAVEEL